MHRHRAVKSRIEPFFGCLGDVDRRGCNPASHGWACRHEWCSCGAERRTNFNQGRDESTGWYMPADKDADA